MDECVNADDLEEEYTKIALEGKVNATEISIADVDKRVSYNFDEVKRMLWETVREISGVCKRSGIASISSASRCEFVSVVERK